MLNRRSRCSRMAGVTTKAWLAATARAFQLCTFATEASIALTVPTRDGAVRNEKEKRIYIYYKFSFANVHTYP